MSTFLHVVLWLIVAAITLWALIFGGIGVAIARVCGKSLWSGFGWGFCLGPIGWLVLLFVRPRDRFSTISGYATPPGRADREEGDISALATSEDVDAPPDVL